MVLHAARGVVGVGDGAGGHGSMLQSLTTTETTAAPTVYPEGQDGDGVQTAPLLLRTQLCLSVKTQPHAVVLRAAEAAGFHAECISMAEVHAAHAAGFDTTRIVLTVGVCVRGGVRGGMWGVGGTPWPDPHMCSLLTVLAGKDARMYSPFIP